MTSRLAYGVSEVAELTSLSRSTIYNLVKSGQLKLIRIGGRSVILHDDLMQLLSK